MSIKNLVGRTILFSPRSITGGNKLHTRKILTEFSLDGQRCYDVLIPGDPGEHIQANADIYDHLFLTAFHPIKSPYAKDRPLYPHTSPLFNYKK